MCVFVCLCYQHGQIPTSDTNIQTNQMYPVRTTIQKRNIRLSHKGDFNAPASQIKVRIQNKDIAESIFLLLEAALC